MRFRVVVLYVGAAILCVHSGVVAGSTDGEPRKWRTESQSVLRVDTVRVDRIADPDHELVKGSAPGCLEARYWICRDPMDRAHFEVRSGFGDGSSYKITVIVKGDSLILGPYRVEWDSAYESERPRDSLIELMADVHPACWSWDGRWLALPMLRERAVDVGFNQLLIVNLEHLAVEDSIGPLVLGVLGASLDPRFLVYSDLANLWLLDLGSRTRVRVFGEGGYEETGGENYWQYFSNLLWSRQSDYFEVEYHPGGLATYVLRVFTRQE